MFLLFDMMDTSHSDGLRPEKTTQLLVHNRRFYLQTDTANTSENDTADIGRTNTGTTDIKGEGKK